MIAAGVIGWPVAHSKSPLIHRFWLAKLEINGDYGRFAVHPDHLGDAIRALPKLGMSGVNVTVPHKVAAMAYLDEIEPDAARIGAINTILIGSDGRTLGLNTDDVGFIDPLRFLAPTIGTATVIGAGGAARAVLTALKMMDVRIVTLINRSEARSWEVSLDFPSVRSVVPLVGEVMLEPTDLVVNATSLGMIGQSPLPVLLDRLGPDTIVYDLVYAPLETQLLSDARRRGLSVIGGIDMLVGQAAAAFYFIFGSRPPREHDAELRALLTA